MSHNENFKLRLQFQTPTADKYTMQNLRAIEIKFYPATNHRPARVRLRDTREIIPRALWLSTHALPEGYRGVHSGALYERVVKYLETYGWEFQATTQNGTLLLTEDFSISEWRAIAPDPRLEALQGLKKRTS